MKPGTLVIPPLIQAGQNVLPLRRLGDLEETRLLIADRNRARAIDLLVAQSQSERQDRQQAQAIAATQEAARQAAETTGRILEAGQIAQAQSVRSFRSIGVTAIAVFALVAIVRAFRPQKETAA